MFIGAGSIVLPNVQIGDNSIVGAGSIVTKDISPNVVCGGNPAKVISTLDDFIKKNREQMKESPLYSEDYTLRGNISEQKKNKQREELKNKIGYIV